MAAVVLSLCACDQTSVRNCRLEPGSNANTWSLSYKFDQMNYCPLPLRVAGEMKDAGGVITDNGSRDFFMASLEMKNYYGTSQEWRSDIFQTVGTNVYTAHPVLRYPAGTGIGAGNYPTDPPQAQTEDRGYFRAHRTSDHTTWEQGATGTLYVLYHKSTASVSIGGEDLPVRYTSQTWTAAGANGTAPYSYKWYRNGTVVSNSSSYSTTVDTSDFGLRAEIVDAHGATAYRDIWIDVDGIRGTITGPDIAYYSSGGATWYASGRGGAYPYVFDWYVIDPDRNETRWVGRGPSWTGYPAEGSPTLHVKVTNGTPEHHDVEKPVTGIGNGECSPVPPALICDG